MSAGSSRDLAGNDNDRSNHGKSRAAASFHGNEIARNKARNDLDTALSSKPDNPNTGSDKPSSSVYSGRHPLSSSSTFETCPPPPSSRSQTRTFPPSQACASTTSPLQPPFSVSSALASSFSSSNISPSSSFAQLAFRTFETYINEAKAADDYYSQLYGWDVNPCTIATGNQGTGGIAVVAAAAAARLGGPLLGHPASSSWITPQSSFSPYEQQQQPHQKHPFEPIALRRHIHSTPLRHAPSIVSKSSSGDEDEVPPIGLEILNRSRSTPLSTSKNSAFGTTILRTNSNSLYDATTMGVVPPIGGSNSSAFSLPSYPMSKANSRSAERRSVIFNPIKSREDDDEERKKMTSTMNSAEEMASIEVTDLQHLSQFAQGGTNKFQTSPAKKHTAASRAAKFLADVRSLRLTAGSSTNPQSLKSASETSNGGREDNATSLAGNKKRSSSGSRRHRGGWENPAKPPSVSSDESSMDKTSITPLPLSSAGRSIANDTTAFKSDSSRDSVKGKTNKDTSAVIGLGADKRRSNETRHSHQKDSKARFQNPHVTEVDSPTSVPSSTTYHPLTEENLNVNSSKMSDKVVCDRRLRPVVSSPEPGQVTDPTLTYQSHNSPDSTKYSSSTGYTTHSSKSGGYVTNLSVISETDQEVANLNDSSAGGKNDRIELLLSADRNVRFGEYVELVDSPSPINPSRDGASVQADRFFRVNGTGKRDRRSLARLRTLPSSNRKVAALSNSPTTISSASANTNSDSSSMGSEPPKIVSYLDRKQISDLTSLHNRGESNSTSRPGLDDPEVRDSSPSDLILVEDSKVVFEGAEAPKLGFSARKPRPMWPGKGLYLGRKIRSLPPRSPHKGLRCSTTPPPGSIGSSAISSVSTPLQIPDHHNRIDPNTSNQSASSGSSGSSYYNGGSAVEPGSQEVVRLSPSLGMSSSAASSTSSSYVMIPRGLSPLGGQGAILVGRGGSPRMYEETIIEILKSHSKDDNGSGSYSNNDSPSGSILSVISSAIDNNKGHHQHHSSSC